VTPDPLREASLGWLLASWQTVRAERMGLGDTLACVEPPDAQETLREAILRDYRAIRAELARRRQLLDGIPIADIGDDGAMLVLRPT
jgi:hypothetical protein